MRQMRQEFDEMPMFFEKQQPKAKARKSTPIVSANSTISMGMSRRGFNKGKLKHKKATRGEKTIVAFFIVGLVAMCYFLVTGGVR